MKLGPGGIREIEFIVQAFQLIRGGQDRRIQSQSLLDVIDTVIDKGLAVDAEIVLGLADIDLIYLRVGALLAAADRVFGQPPKQRRKVAAPNRVPSSAPYCRRVSATASARSCTAHSTVDG